jgi:hypothetical protein
MPCTYTGSIEGDRALASSETITELTQVICQFMSNLENVGALEQDYIWDCVPIKLEEFWNEHKKIDAVRREAVRIAALKKLTDEEKEVLGL